MRSIPVILPKCNLYAEEMVIFSVKRKKKGGGLLILNQKVFIFKTIYICSI